MAVLSRCSSLCLILLSLYLSLLLPFPFRSVCVPRSIILFHTVFSLVHSRLTEFIQFANWPTSQGPISSEKKRNSKSFTSTSIYRDLSRTLLITFSSIRRFLYTVSPCPRINTCSRKAIDFSDISPLFVTLYSTMLLYHDTVIDRTDETIWTSKLSSVPAGPVSTIYEMPVGSK